MAALALSPENSLDQFIRDTKLKLRYEREGLAGQDRGGRTSGRKQWNKQEPAENTRFAQQPPADESPRKGKLYNYKQVEKDYQEQRKRDYNRFLQQVLSHIL